MQAVWVLVASTSNSHLTKVGFSQLELSGTSEVHVRPRWLGTARRNDAGG